MFKQKSKVVSILILAAFISTSVKSPAYAYSAVDFFSRLPAPGVMVRLSPEYIPAHLQGITIHPDNALRFDFLINKGDENLQGTARQQEYKSLVKYFLASLTIPDANQWVNLSPYEKDRIIQDDFGKTEMGRDLLAQDYVLKQMTSSLIYPEAGLGKKFWNTIYERAWKEYHTTEIPVNTFNKVWIVPDQATVYESGNTAYILQSHLKVMLEEDYLSLQRHGGIATKAGQDGELKPTNTHVLGSQVIREVILPALEKEVNEGQNFARLRQIYSGMIIAAWYKKRLKESLLGMVYVDKGKVRGVDYNDPKAKEAIYHRYLQAFKKGVYNYIKEDFDTYKHQVIPRKYFSGGFSLNPDMLKIVRPGEPVNSAMMSNALKDLRRGNIDKAMVSFGEVTKNVFNVLRLTALGVLTVVGASNAIAQTNELPRYSKFGELNRSQIENPAGPSFSSDLFGEQSPSQEPQVALATPLSLPRTTQPKPPLPNAPSSLFQAVTSEYRTSEFLSILDIERLLNKLTPPDSGFNNVDSAVNWLNQSIEPYQLFVDYLKKNGTGILNPDLIPPGFENFTESDFEKFNQTEQGKKLKRLILNLLPAKDYQQGISEQNGEYTPVPYNPTKKNLLIFNAKNALPLNDDFRLGPFHDNFNLGPIHVNKGNVFIPFPRGVELSFGAKAPKPPPNMIYNHMKNQSGGLSLKIPLDVFKKSKEPVPNKVPNKDKAMVTPGGIDLNASNLDLQIQRDGNGVPLPLRDQDTTKLQNIEGFVPIIIDIQPLSSLPIFK